ncbi:hypothetical protein E4U41_000082 [Claviceps citrina]|nr:hypothetical protein E4U41_000082 [Claviceps citrina]
MSRQTPRRPRHTRQPSNLIPAVSDYESDAVALHAASYAAPPPRTNTELNVNVLQRYLPSIQTILSIAANAVVYTLDSGSTSWDKSGVEGTMFVCTQSPHPESGQPRACVFVLNRRGLDNLIVDLARVSHVEIAGELVIFKVEGGTTRLEDDKVIGLWIHNDREETRQINGATIQEIWKVTRSPGLDEDQGQDQDQDQDQDQAKGPDAGPEAGPAMQVLGRRLSVQDLFGGQRGHHPVN